MAETIIIDIKTNYTDNMSPNIEASAKSLDRLEQSLQRTSKMMGSLGNGGRFQASFDLQDNASKQMDSILAGVKRLSGISTIRFAVDIIDRVTQPLQNIMSMAMNAGQNLGNMIMQRGWTRVTELDAAKAKLAGLGNTVQDIQEISQNASDAVTGTAYSLNEAVTAAASAVAAGMKPGAQLKQYLTDIADVAGISGRSMGEIGSIMNSVVTTGKAQNDTLQRFAERGLPIYQWLAKTLGTEEAMVTKMAKDGQIGIDALQAAIQDNIAGAAQEMGDKTILGVLANINAAYAKLGEAIIGASDDQSSLAGQAHEFLLAYKTDVNTLKPEMVEIGKTLAGFVDQLRPQAIELMHKGFQGLVDRMHDLNDVMKSPEFQNAGLLGKFKIAWDAVIGDPFSQWWDSKGHQLFITKANELGTSLGSGLSTIIKGIFGFNAGDGGVVDSATSVGAGFAQGFLQGFDGSGVAKAIADSLARAFKDVIGSIFSGKLGGSTLLNGLLLAGAGRSLMGLGPVVKGIEGLFGGGVGRAAMASGAGAVASGGAEVLASGGASGGGLINKLFGGIAAETGISTGFLAAGSIASIASATVATIGGVKDLLESQMKETTREEDAYRTSGVMKLGATGIGALAGSVAGPLGALVGAGFGGLIGMFAGNAIRNNASKADKSLERLTKGTTEYAKAANYATKNMATLSYTTDEVNSAVKSIYGDGSVFTRGNEMIQSGQSVMGRVSSAVTTVQGMQQQVQAGVNLTDAEAEQYVTSLNETMNGSLEAVTTYANGMFLNMQTSIANSEGEAANTLKQARTDYATEVNRVKQVITDDQKAVNDLIESYSNGEISFDQLVEKSSKYVDEVKETSDVFTNMGNSQKKLMDVMAPHGHTADAIEQLSNKFMEYDKENEEANAIRNENLANGYASTYGVGSDAYINAIEQNYKQTLMDQSQKRSESLGYLINELPQELLKDAESYLSGKSLIDVFKGDAYNWLGFDSLSGMSPSAAMETVFDTSGDKSDKQYGDMIQSATDYGASIQDWVDNIQGNILELEQNGMAIPESMMKNYESGIKILAAAGKGSAMIQQAANELAQEANDENSRYHDEALGIIDSILHGTEDYFQNEDLEQAFESALKSSRYGKELLSEDYNKLSAGADERAFETDKLNVYEGGGATEGYRYGVGKEKIQHSAEEAMKEAEKYTVQAGDTVWGILKNFLGHEPTQEDLNNFQQLNAERFSNGNLGLINTGEELILSEGTAKAEEPKKVAKSFEGSVYEGGGATKGYRYGVGSKLTGMSSGMNALAEPNTVEEVVAPTRKAPKNMEDLFKVPFKPLSEEQLANVEYAQLQSTATSFSKETTAGVKSFGEAISGTVGGFFSNIGTIASKAIPEWVSQVGPQTTPMNPVEEAEYQEGLSRNVGQNFSFSEIKSGISDFFGDLLLGGPVMAAELPETVQARGDRGHAGLHEIPQGIPLEEFQGISTASTETEAGGGGFGEAIASIIKSKAQSILEQMDSAAEQALQEIQAQAEQENQQNNEMLDMNYQYNLENGGASSGGQSVESTASTNLTVDTSQADTEIAAKSQEVLSNMQAQFDGLTSPPATATAPVMVIPQVTVQEQSVTVGVKGQGGATTLTIGQIGGHAAGGLVNGAELSWLAEEGYPEMVIPFAPHRRGRALDLLAQAEDALGVSRHANGGIVGGMLPSGDGEYASDSGSSGGNGTVNVGGIVFEINSNGGDVVSQVQSRASEITEIVTNALADALEQAYENTPLAAG